jgi:toxin-antitoxin system PIN domain toxin
MHHQQARSRLEQHRASPELLALFPPVIAGFLRVVTDRRILNRPADPDAALAFVDALLAGPSVAVTPPGARYWPIARDLLATYRPRGPEVPDVLLAAAALEQGATWISYDRGFARFRGLEWVNPLDA